MVADTRFNQIMENKKPILAFNPLGLNDLGLVKAVNKAGGIGLINLERMTAQGYQAILIKCLSEITNIVGIRVVNKDQLNFILEHSSKQQSLILIIADVSLSKEQIKLAKEKRMSLIAEVISLEEAYDKKWADVFLLKGAEAGGRVSDETSFILTQQFAEAGLEFIVQGGVGIYTTPALFAAGAKAVVLDTQLYTMPECPLSKEVKDFLVKLDATDTKIIGDSTSYKYRVYARLATKIVKDFIKIEKDLLGLSLEERTKKIKQKIEDEKESFNSPTLANCLLPIGQDVSFINIFSKRFSSVEEVFDGLLEQTKKQIKNTLDNYPFKSGSDLAKDLGIKYPLIQGPMANISESPEFAKIIAEEGALPILALGSLFKNQSRNLIKKTKETLGSLPFGCGIIGLDANATARDNHLVIIKEIQPSLVVVAAGTIDLAKEVMSYGDIKTFLHSPSPLIFSEAIETDVRYLVLEGMECGGHIGILTSFVLWELSLHQLVRLQDKIKASGKKINVAFAGGIGDRFSAAMVAVIASALPDLMNSALWVGTAYILTEEIVDTGAVKPLYREQALDAKETVLLGETVSIRARTIPTPYAKVIVERELERIKDGISLKERKHLFERDNLGSTRIAALGEIWNPDGEDDKPNRFVPIDEKGQYEKGNYMIGQIVGSLRSIRTVKDLHMELIEESKRVVSTKGKSITKQFEAKDDSVKTINSQIEHDHTSPIPDDIPHGEGVAIVGLGGIFPDALNIDQYWKNITLGLYSVKEIPKERWSNDLSLFYSPDPFEPDKTYAKIAATIDDFKFNSLEFKIPPKVALRMDRVQQFALVAAKEALIDANILDKDNSNTAVIIGNSMGGEIRVDYNRRIFLPETYRSLEKCASFSNIDKGVWKKVKEELKVIYDSDLLSINEDSMPGELSNVIAGRVANVFNLRGKSMTCDAACASSLAALNISVKGLLDNEYDVVLCGGSDCSLDASIFVKFAKIGAISAEGSYPFDKRANGFVMGEGAGFVVLKRLSDAERDGDKIYAVIRGLGAASDGKGKGITAPNPIGQKLAIQRALDQAGVTFPDIQFIEAHGTATGVGDVVEMAVLNEMAENTPKSSIVISSVKSQIGHLKSAAGIASTIKTALALYHKKFPPTANFKYPNPKVAWETSPFYVTTEVKDWPQPVSGHRIAGISSFGFGGTNFHAIMEEYIPGETIGHLPKLFTKEELDSLVLRVSQMALHSGDGQGFTTVFDEASWENFYNENIVLETEPLFVGGTSDAALLKNLKALKTKIPKSTFALNGTGTRIHDFSQETMSALSQKKRIGIVSKSLDDLPSLIDSAISGQQDKAKRLILRNKGIFYGEDHSLGKIAFMFPGQGSQYVRMGKELWDKYDIVKEAFKEADEVTQTELGFSLTEIIFAIGKDDAEAKALLRKTEVTQPAIFAVNIGIYRLLRSFGIKPDFVAGHSLGEYAALVASGIVSFKDGLMAVIPRGKAMSLFESDDNGMMASVSSDAETIEEVLKSVKGYVIAANKNTPSQTVISGASPAIKEAIKIFIEKGITAIPLPVSAAFHSEIVAPAEKFLRESLEKLTFNKPSIALSSNVTGGIYPETRQEIIDLLCKQVYSPVEWMKQIENMYEEYGVRTFIEIGPKYVLTSFAKSVLNDKKDFVALASNHPKRGAMQHLNEVLAALGAFGYPLKIPNKDDSIYSEEFRNPTKRFFKRKAISIPSIAPSTSTPKVITKESPFDVLAFGDLASITKNDDFNDYLELQAPAINAFLKAGYDTYQNIIAKALETKKEIDRLNINTDAVGVTGIAIGLPGKNRKVFDDSNFDAILSGQNFIEKTSVQLREKIVEKNIVRLVKDAVKGAQFQSITDVSEVIKLAAQKGEFDLTKDYGVQAEFTEIFDVTFQLALAAGIEALKDAGIPLMPLKIKTSVGKEISKGWVLPESMRDETGIVFASAFPASNNLISIVSQSLADKYASKHKDETILLFDELIQQISNKTSRENVTKWFEKNKASLAGDKKSKYQFSRKFLFEVLSMGHSQFAQFIRARGPNTQVNAACSSTTLAIGIAEDWIRNGRCKRVIVIAADDITSDETFQWFGSGFLAVGAATTSEIVEEAALPFDNRRHGMIVGMGAVGIVLESESTMNERGIKPIVDLMGTHLVNSAFHGTRLDRDHISSQMSDFIGKMEKRFNVSRDDIAKQLVFVSHETYTPARGGSASAEIDALRKTFGASLDKVVIANTKGFTGHAMGAGIEDVVAVKMLQEGIIPPVANFKEVDPELGVLNLSKGGKYNIKYALRFSAGFGSQLAMVLYRLNTASGRFDSKDYDRWLATIGGSRSTMKISNNTLRMTEDPNIAKTLLSTPTPRSSVVSASNSEVVTMIISLLSEKTGYPADMIEADMHLEEDLGIDTVKQAELFGMLRTQYNLPREEGVRIQDYYSVNKIAEYLATKMDPVASTSVVAGTSSIPISEITKVIIDLVSEKTGYPQDMLEADMELEEDLGIDTVKQAEIFGILRTKWDLPREEGIRIQEYSTITKIAKYVSDRIASSSGASASTSSQPSKKPLEKVPAQRMQLQLIPSQIKTKGLDLKQKQFIVVGDNNIFTKDIVSILEKKKARVVKTINLKSMKSLDKLKAALPKEQVDGLVFIAPKTTVQTKHDLVARSFFICCRYLSFNEKPIVLSIDNLSENLGWKQIKSNPIVGSLTGFTKALAREFVGGTVKFVSCQKPKQAIDELCTGDGSVEVLYNSAGKRQIFITTVEELEEAKEKYKPTKDDLIVITGGAQGITFEISKKIAEKYQAKLALFGRTKIPRNIKELLALDEAGLTELKNAMVAKMKETDDRVTPVKIEKAWSKTAKAIAIQKGVQELVSLGSKAKYYSVDVVDTEKMKKILLKVTSDFKTSITGIVHGAGLEVSKYIADKELTDFNQVYNVKAIGYDNLINNIDLKKIQFIICFSSVAGRYGNGGQVDYSAANDYLSKSCWNLRAKGIRATSICWTAWAEVGMATRGSIMTILEYAGVTPIQVNEGINAFINELESGQDAEVVIAGKLGVLMDSPLPAVTVDNKAYPMIGSIRRNYDGSITTEREFSLTTDLYLNHHRFDAVPFLPGVMGMELFAELAKLAYPKKVICGFDSVEFRSAIKFIKDNPRLLNARISYSSKPEVRIESDFIKDGKKLGDTKLHFKANVIFGPRKASEKSNVKLAKKQLINKGDIYQILPHGSLFQVLKSINTIDKEITAVGSIPLNNQFSWDVKELLANPLAIEAAFQAMGLLDIIKDDRLGLPYSIKQLTYRDVAGEPEIIRGIKIGENDIGSTYNFEVLTKTGEVILTAENYNTVKIPLATSLEIVDSIRLKQVKQLFTVPKDSSIEVVNVKQINEKIQSESEYLANNLQRDELEKYSSIKIEKRKNEWLAGVIAAKTALRNLMPNLENSDILIEKSDLGKPIAVTNKGKKKTFVSITHSNGYAIALVSSSLNVGIDLEIIEPRDSSLIDELLAPKEQSLLNIKNQDISDEKLTIIWAAKEAVSKVLGIGLNIDLHDLEIVKLQNNSITVQVDPSKLPAEANKIIKQFAKNKSGMQLKAQISNNDEFVAAVCFIPK